MCDPISRGQNVMTRASKQAYLEVKPMVIQSGEGVTAKGGPMS